MFGLSMWELALIALVVIFVVGPKRLPDVAKSIGKGYGEFKRTFNEMKQNVSLDDNNINVKKNRNNQSEQNNNVRETKTAEDYAAHYRSQWEEKIVDNNIPKETNFEKNNKNSDKNNDDINDMDSKYLKS